MPVKRVFLGWDQPALHRAVEYLVERFARNGRADLLDVIVVLPGARAGRRLQELLVERCERQGLALFPPQVVTVGELPERLYAAKLPFASELVQQLAWVRALQEMPADRRRHLLPAPPDNADFFAWLALAERLARLHRELAADRLDFDSVANRLEQLRQDRLPAFSEGEIERWRVLRELQRSYLDQLDQLQLWDRQTARLYAIDHGECQTHQQIVLVGTVDLNQALRAMLDQVADRVTALVFAPPELSDRFDQHGCLIPLAWQDDWVRLSDEQVRVVEGPEQQADEVLQVLAELDGAYAVDEVTVGVPDERVVPFVQQRLRQCGLPVRYGAGQQLGQAGPVRFASVAAEFLEGRSYSAYASLLRHPDVTAWLQSKGLDRPTDPLVALDDFYQNHLPPTVTEALLDQVDAPPAVRVVFDAVCGLLQPLVQCAVSDLPAALQQVLQTLYGGRSFDPSSAADRRVLRACQRLVEAATELAAVPPALEPNLSAPAALQLVVRQVSDEVVGPDDEEPAIELLGWLELPLGDAPVLVVTGFNEGFVPSSRNADQFLPDSLRRHLQLEDNARRYARDLYALKLLASTRQRLVLVAGRRTADNDPLLPSRLLFPDDDSLPRRTLQLLQPQPTVRRRLPGELQAGRVPNFPVPRLKPLEQRVRHFRVTEFRDFLSCPYRYFLKHRLGLGRVADDAVEMSGGLFGELVHQVLCDFGRSELKDSTSAEQIAEYLQDRLADLARRRFSPTPLPSVRIQLAQARDRLRQFARWQAQHRNEGWRIHCVEHAVSDEQVPFSVDDELAYLIGRVDRVDVHEQTGRVLVLDYKTADSGKGPEESHRKRSGEWVDLQLPLYRHLVRPLGLSEPVRLGFVLLPRELERVGLEEADWEEADLESADEEARRVIRSVWAHDFDRPVQPPPDFWDDYAPICQDLQFSVSGDDEGAWE